MHFWHSFGTYGFRPTRARLQVLPPASVNDGTKLFKFPETGVLKTSSSGPERGTDRKYLYYSKDGSTREVPMDYGKAAGMIWGQYEGTKDGVISEFGFFARTEEQYSKAKSRRPIQ